MPEVKDKMTGKTVAKMTYDPQGQMAAEKNGCRESWI